MCFVSWGMILRRTSPSRLGADLLKALTVTVPRAMLRKPIGRTPFAFGDGTEDSPMFNLGLPWVSVSVESVGEHASVDVVGCAIARFILRRCSIPFEQIRSAAYVRPKGGSPLSGYGGLCLEGNGGALLFAMADEVATGSFLRDFAALGGRVGEPGGDWRYRRGGVEKLS